MNRGRKAPDIGAAFGIYRREHTRLTRAKLYAKIKKEANVSEWQMLNALERTNRLPAWEKKRLEAMRDEKKRQEQQESQSNGED